MISQKISKCCGIIYQIRNNLDIKYMKLIYYSLIHPYLTYCINECSLTYQANRKSVSTVQTRYSQTKLTASMRHIYSSTYFTPCYTVYLGILTYKVNSGQYLFRNFLTDAHVNRHHH